MKKLIRPLVDSLHAYVPGEQPKIAGLIKLNTNENPYQPSPKVLRAVKAAVDGRLRLYPNPTAQPLRERLAKFHRCTPENIIVGNGSDELLALATRAFVEPACCEAGLPSRRRRQSCFAARWLHERARRQRQQFVRTVADDDVLRSAPVKLRQPLAQGLCGGIRIEPQPPIHRRLH